MIRENKMAQITTAMQTGKKDGMQTLEEHLNVLVAKGVISYEAAVAKANQPESINQPLGSPSPAGTR
jgi:twitching motility protein PilT